MRNVKYLRRKVKKILQIKLLLIAILFGLSITVYSQTLFKDESSVKRYVNTNDSIVEFNALCKEKEIKTKPGCEYLWYKSDKIRKTENGYSGKLLHGQYQVFYYPSMKLKRQGQLKNGLQNGIWKSWYQNSKLRASTSWKNGKLHGTCTYYSDNGDIQKVLNYKHGVLHGNCNYYKAGKLVLTKKFKKSDECIKVKRRQLKPVWFKRKKTIEPEPELNNKET